MDPFNTAILELIADDDWRRRLEQRHYSHAEPARPRAAPGELRRVFASMVVRLGLRLYPVPGEGLRILERGGEGNRRSSMTGGEI